MLTGIQAFEARWIDLKSHHPTTKDDNTVIAHAMGQLIDQYETPLQIERELPDHLQKLFRELAQAYFQGYSPLSEAEEPGISVVTEVLSSGAKTCDISIAVEKVKVLARNARRSDSPSSSKPVELSEADTLIIEFPEGWPHS
ncbi:MAG TPA: hypothetical protein V6D29_24565 [Leptolyngbyaceae cyanobacterium]